MKTYLLFFLILVSAVSIFAREITILVVDSDLDIPLEGALVRTRDGNEFRCDENGKVVFQASDTQLLVYVSYPGYENGVLLIPSAGNNFILPLRLSGIIHGRELIIEESRPGANETRTGRSIAVNTREISQTGEIGIIEDVMNTIKLLPGVNYTGMLNAQPSIRGGYPGDMSASLDGFYIMNPYFWGGGFSIFDPRMVQSAQLSHGVFSSRYGHTISGLLEITTKYPDPTETLFELGLNTSAANFSLSVPLSGKGGILFMGRITYYDPIVSLAKELSKNVPELEDINFIRQAPYIRTTTITGKYRFTDTLEVSMTAFWGMDGIGVNYQNTSISRVLESETTLDFDFKNFQGFIVSSVLWNPRNDMLLKLTAGSGYEDMIINGNIRYNIYNRNFSNSFKNKYPDLYILKDNPLYFNMIKDPYGLNDNTIIDQSNFLFNAQLRLDYDWELSDRILVSAGVQEMFNRYYSSGFQKVTNDIRFINLSAEEKSTIKLIFPSLTDETINNLRISVPIEYSPKIENFLFTTSGYFLTEYNTGNRFKTELGLRIDHFYLTGNGFSLESDPALNPRLNIDINLINNRKIIQKLDFSAGTGLFSSMNNNVFAAEEQFNLSKIKPNRSWTSIIGLKFEFPDSLSLNIESYYKYIFDRMYIPMLITLDNLDIIPQFDGEGISWGLDVMLHKVQSRYWDGWLSYSYNWTKYRDPSGRIGSMGISGGNRGNSWYYPSFHRFHNLNLIFNYKPIQSMNIYLRFGYASGVPLTRRSGEGPLSFPVLQYEQKNIIEKYYWPSYQDENNRTTPSFPMDIKYSIFGGNKTGKTRYEVYVAIENILSLVYNAEGNTSFNQYTGQIDTGSNSASYEIPMPIPSFGVKISY